MGSSNFYIWKYLITCIAKKDKLYTILLLLLLHLSKQRKKEADDNETKEDRVERFKYILSVSIKPSLMV